jgi:hypothetical protein
MDIEFADKEFMQDPPPMQCHYPAIPGEYELWGTQGQGGILFGSYSTFKEALADVKIHAGSCAFGIKYPSGRWHKWKDFSLAYKSDIAFDAEFEITCVDSDAR